MGRTERQLKLQQYNFKCECEACTDNYPEYLMLPQPKNVPEIVLNTDAMDKIFMLDYKFAYDHYDNYKEFLSRYDRYYPCNQICNVQEAMKMFYNIYLNNLPLHVQKKGPDVCNCKQAKLRKVFYSKLLS